MLVAEAVARGLRPYKIETLVRPQYARLALYFQDADIHCGVLVTPDDVTGRDLGATVKDKVETLIEGCRGQGFDPREGRFTSRRRVGEERRK